MSAELAKISREGDADRFSWAAAMILAALQFPVTRADVRANSAAVRAGLERAAEAGADLVVLPELWATSFCDEDEVEGGATPAAQRALDELCRASRELDLVVCGTGLAPAGGGARPHNRLTFVERGEVLASYDKVHLFSPTGETVAFSAGGAPPPVLDARGARLSGVVCYDLRFGPLVRACFLGGAEVVVCPAQWPTPRAAHWRALVLGRAAEGQCFVVACNRTGQDRVGRRALELEFPGNSLVAGPDGTARAEGRGEDGLVLAEVDLGEVRELRRRVPVWRDAREELYRSWSSEANP